MILSGEKQGSGIVAGLFSDGPDGSVPVPGRTIGDGCSLPHAQSIIMSSNKTADVFMANKVSTKIGDLCLKTKFRLFVICQWHQFGEFCCVLLKKTQKVHQIRQNKRPKC